MQKVHSFLITAKDPILLSGSVYTARCGIVASKFLKLDPPRAAIVEYDHSIMSTTEVSTLMVSIWDPLPAVPTPNGDMFFHQAVLNCILDELVNHLGPRPVLEHHPITTPPNVKKQVAFKAKVNQAQVAKELSRLASVQVKPSQSFVVQAAPAASTEAAFNLSRLTLKARSNSKGPGSSKSKSKGTGSNKSRGRKGEGTSSSFATQAQPHAQARQANAQARQNSTLANLSLESIWNRCLSLTVVVESLTADIAGRIVHQIQHYEDKLIRLAVGGDNASSDTNTLFVMKQVNDTTLILSIFDVKQDMTRCESVRDTVLHEIINQSIVTAGGSKPLSTAETPPIIADMIFSKLVIKGTVKHSSLSLSRAQQVEMETVKKMCKSWRVTVDTDVLIGNMGSEVVQALHEVTLTILENIRGWVSNPRERCKVQYEVIFVDRCFEFTYCSPAAESILLEHILMCIRRFIQDYGMFTLIEEKCRTSALMQRKIFEMFRMCVVALEG